MLSVKGAARLSVGSAAGSEDVMSAEKTRVVIVLNIIG
jgi:hypothetical protein